MQLTIEPINCFEGDDDLVNRVADAMAIIVQVDSSQQGVFVDCFHINLAQMLNTLSYQV